MTPLYIHEEHGTYVLPLQMQLGLYIKTRANQLEGACEPRFLPNLKTSPLLTTLRLRGLSL